MEPRAAIASSANRSILSRLASLTTFGADFCVWSPQTDANALVLKRTALRGFQLYMGAQLYCDYKEKS